MNIRTTLFAATALVALSCLASTATANLVHAASWTGGGVEKNFHSAVGWQFTAKSDLDVTHLGVLDLGEAGLSDRHEVGIFDSDGDLLVSTSIPSGLNGNLMLDSMIYNSIGLVTLQKDETYYILADNWNEDTYLFGDSAVNYSNDVEWVAHSWTMSNSIFDSVVHEGSNEGGALGNLGPGFLYRVAPSPGALALLGLAGCASRRRRSACTSFLSFLSFLLLPSSSPATGPGFHGRRARSVRIGTHENVTGSRRMQ